MSIVIAIVVSVIVVIMFKFLNCRSKPAIFGVYQQPNKCYYVKYFLMYLVLKSKQLLTSSKRRYDEHGNSDDRTQHVHKDDAALEEIQNLGTFPQAVDGVYFNGTSKSGAVLVCGVNRRQQGICEAFLFLKVEGGELLLSPKLPESNLQQTAEEVGQYKVEGIHVKNIIPMRSWKIIYSGEMKSRSDPSKRVHVEADLTWSTKWCPFNYATELNASGMARDVARENWTLDYFRMLQRYQQEHYEQIGEVTGTATIDGNQHTISVDCLRDHSFSQHREWRDIHRYVYHFIYLENGDRIAFGALSKPIAFSHFTAGYVCRESDHLVHAISTSTFQLYQHGERGTPPTQYAFTFNACGQTYEVKVTVKDEEVFYQGEDREAKFHERWCDFEVNGVKGWGATEWYYKNLTCL